MIFVVSVMCCGFVCVVLLSRIVRIWLVVIVLLSVMLVGCVLSSLNCMCGCCRC